MKVLTSIIANDIYEHLEREELIPKEQKENKRNSRGTKYQILIDKLILKDCRLRQKHLSMAWIDYRKAYDTVPDSWILDSLQLMRVHPGITTLLKEAMKKWNTEHTIKNSSIGQVSIVCVIFQGDSLSSLLFVIALILLSTIIQQSCTGYKIDNGSSINHILYMDDLKLYGKTRKD